MLKLKDKLSGGRVFTFSLPGEAIRLWPLPPGPLWWLRPCLSVGM